MIPEIVAYNDPSEIHTEHLRRWLKKAQEMQWEFGDLVKRKGRPVRLK